MAELKAAMHQREEIASTNTEDQSGSLPGSERSRLELEELAGGITPFQPFREAR